mgnify:FL=1
MNKRLIIKNLSKLMTAEAFLMLLPALVSVIYKEYRIAIIFTLTAAVIFALFLPLSLVIPRGNKIYAKEGFAIVALAWITWSLAGAVPFYISGVIPNYIDCFFETVSGLTTTGATILTEITSLPKGILFWRSFTHWIGGMGVLVFVMAVVRLSENSMNLMRAEVPGPTVGKLVPRGGKSAKILYGMYLALTLLEIVFLLFGKMPLFDSINHAFSTAGTGGFSIKNESIAYYNSAYIDGVITVFMFLFGVNFNIYYFMILKNLRAAFKDEELKVYFAVVTCFTLIISLNILPLYKGFGEALRYASFQVCSVISTTGFITYDFTLWPQLSQMLLLFLMITGACAGSTGGGIKIIRVVMLSKMIKTECKNLLNPREVHQIKINGKAVQPAVVRGSATFFIIYFAVLVSSVLAVSAFNVDLVTNLSSVMTCIGNVGPGLGKIVGPVGNFSSLPEFVKIVLCADMLFGRLEFFPLIMIFSPRLWRRKFL